MSEWENLGGGLLRMEVEGGWLYRLINTVDKEQYGTWHTEIVSDSITFVPKEKR